MDMNKLAAVKACATNLVKIATTLNEPVGLPGYEGRTLGDLTPEEWVAARQKMHEYNVRAAGGARAAQIPLGAAVGGIMGMGLGTAIGSTFGVHPTAVPGIATGKSRALPGALLGLLAGAGFGSLAGLSLRSGAKERGMAASEAYLDNLQRAVYPSSYADAWNAAQSKQAAAELTPSSKEAAKSAILNEVMARKQAQVDFANLLEKTAMATGEEGMVKTAGYYNACCKSIGSGSSFGSYSHSVGSVEGPDWADQFKNTALYPQALQLSMQKKQLDIQRSQISAQEGQLYEQQQQSMDQIRDQFKPQLDQLQAAESQINSAITQMNGAAFEMEAALLQLKAQQAGIPLQQPQGQLPPAVEQAPDKNFQTVQAPQVGPAPINNASVYPGELAAAGPAAGLTQPMAQ